MPRPESTAPRNMLPPPTTMPTWTPLATTAAIARQVAAVVASGVQVGIVVGGGNMFRGAVLSGRGMDRGRADYMGMLGTVINCLALQDFLERAGVETRVQTAIAMAVCTRVSTPARSRKSCRARQLITVPSIPM